MSAFRCTWRRGLSAGAATLTIVAVVGIAVLIRAPDQPADRPVRAPAAAPVAVQRDSPITPTPSPTVTTPPHDVVAKAGPTRFRFTGHGISVDARVCAMSNARPLDPPGEQHHTVCWVREDFGEAPSSRSATTYVLGHSWGQDPQEVLNAVSAPATAQLLAAKPVRRNGVRIYPVTALDGSTITLWTPTGRLDYTVRSSYGVDKYDLGAVRHTMDDRVRNRVVLITCAERKGTDYHYNVVVEAYLTSSRSA